MPTNLPYNRLNAPNANRYLRDTGLHINTLSVRQAVKLKIVNVNGTVKKSKFMTRSRGPVERVWFNTMKYEINSDGRIAEKIPYQYARLVET